MAKKLNLIEVIQKWMDTMAGQTFMNYAYSWGAAVVILGTLFKLTHLPGANLMLFIGMGTEVFVFIVAGFERVTERVPEQTVAGNGLSSETVEELAAVASAAAQNTGGAGGTVVIGGGGVPAGGTVVIGGMSDASGETETETEVENADATETLPQDESETSTIVVGGGAVGIQQPIQQPVMGGVVAQPVVGGAIGAQPIILGGGSPTVIGGTVSEQEQIEATDPGKIEEAVKNYAERLNELTDVLGRVKVQAERMSTDSEEMENLNRTLTGIATVYELQLRNISKQVATIEQIDEQTRRMAQQIEELNNVYARMIQALTINMSAPVTPVAPVVPTAPSEE